jgi:hypothetical protein
MCSIAFSGLCNATDLTGVILNNTGTAISATTVTVARSSVNGPLPAAEAYSTTTAADGSFTVQGLNAGPFIICADGSALGLLDPCEWGSPTVVSVPSGTAVVSTSTQLQLGATVSIRVDDPALLLYASVAASQPHPFLDMGVWSADGHFHHARRISSDSTGYNFTLVVTPSVNLAFAVSFQNIAVTNAATNAPVEASQRVSVNLAPGATLQLHYSLAANATASPTPATNPAANQ